MARGKGRPRRMDDRARRLVGFSRRRNGLLKKASELAVLCDAEVGVVVFSAKGKLYHFPSHSSLEKTIQRYRRFIDAKRSVSIHIPEGLCIGTATQEINHEVLEAWQRFFDDGNIEQLNVNDLTKLEKKLESILGQLRSRKATLLMDLLTKLHEQERRLARENQHLRSVGCPLLALRSHHTSHAHTPDVGSKKEERKQATGMVGEEREEEKPRGGDGDLGTCSSSSSSDASSRPPLSSP